MHGMQCMLQQTVWGITRHKAFLDRGAQCSSCFALGLPNKNSTKMGVRKLNWVPFLLILLNDIDENQTFGDMWLALPWAQTCAAHMWPNLKVSHVTRQQRITKAAISRLCKQAPDEEILTGYISRIFGRRVCWDSKIQINCFYKSNIECKCVSVLVISSSLVDKTKTYKQIPHLTHFIVDFHFLAVVDRSI